MHHWLDELSYLVAHVAIYLTHEVLEALRIDEFLDVVGNF